MQKVQKKDRRKGWKNIASMATQVGLRPLPLRRARKTTRTHAKEGARLGTGCDVAAELLGDEELDAVHMGLQKVQK